MHGNTLRSLSVGYLPGNVPIQLGEAMTSLSQIVLPLAESRALAEAGIVLDTALVWTGVWGINAHWHVESREQIEMIRSNPALDRLENGATFEDRGLVIVAAPTLSELLDAIRAKVHPTAIINNGIDLTVQWVDSNNARPLRELSSSLMDKTEIQAAAALLREVSR